MLLTTLNLIPKSLLCVAAIACTGGIDCWGPLLTGKDLFRILIGHAVRFGAVASIMVFGLAASFADEPIWVRVASCVLLGLSIATVVVSLGLDLFGFSVGGSL